MSDTEFNLFIISMSLAVALAIVLLVKSRKRLRIERERDDLRSELAALQNSHSSLQKDYRLAEVRREGLEDQAARLFELSARIRHDVPKRLEYLWKYIEAKLPDDDDKKQAIEDLETIMQKIKFHVGGDIKERTAEALAEKKGTSVDGMTISQLLTWLLKLHKCEKRSRIKLENDFQIRGPRVAWDLIMTNILSNAINYAGDRGKIYIAVRERDEKGEVDIINTGPHISKLDRGKVFDEGFSTKMPQGRGLGLYIAQQIALGLGGHIKTPENLGGWWLMSRPKVKFTVTNLPIFLPATDDFAVQADSFTKRATPVG